MNVYFAAPRPRELQILKEEGVTHILASYADPDFEDIMEKAQEFDLSIMLDSGAYSAFTKGEGIDIEQYADVLHRYEGLVEEYINLDVCDDHEQTWKNQKELESYGLEPLPVYHYKEPISVLEHYISAGYTYIGIGSKILASQRPQTNYREFIYRITSQHPEIKFHGFAVGAPYPRLMGLHSVDSTTWLSGAKFSRLIGKKRTVRAENAGLFWRRNELIRHNVRALLWKAENTQKHEERQLTLTTQTTTS